MNLPEWPVAVGLVAVANVIVVPSDHNILIPQRHIRPGNHSENVPVLSCTTKRLKELAVDTRRLHADFLKLLNNIRRRGLPAA